MEDIYSEYGKAMVQLEIVQNRVNEIKMKIIEELKKQNGTPPSDKPSSDK
jgi:hypothetical protein